jgi:hypothetical protein
MMFANNPTTKINGAEGMNLANNPAVCTLLFLLALGTSGTALAAVNIELEVQNRDGSNVLVVTRNNAQCSGGPIDCIEVKEGTQPHMNFTLKGACNSVDYALTAFRISPVNKQWPTPDKPLKTTTAEDFCADSESGYIDFMACNNSLSDKKMKLKNFNRFTENVFYEITAANCENPAEEIFLDPQIRNKGGN